MSEGDVTIDAAQPDPFAEVPAPVAGTGTASPRAVLSPDVARAADDLGRGAQAGFLAEVLAHARAETPFTLGVFGPAGSGKSFLAEAMLDAAAALGASGPGGPFATGVVTVRLDARTAAADPAGALAAATLEALAARHPTLATEARHAGSDPVEAARATNESLNEARRRLDAERQTLDALRSREARLPEQVLFEAPGSRIDAYARANRSRIERALQAFGFRGTDPVATYKDLVREAAEQGAGGLSRLGLALRALRAYRGQTKLLVWAVLFALAAWGAAVLQDDQGAWLGAIRAGGDKAAPVADWAQAHAGLLGPIRSAAVALAVLAVGANLLRAARFLQPIGRGVTLLRFDTEARRRDLNGFLAHQTRRVDALAAEVEAATTQAGEAERRAGAAQTHAVAGGGTPGFAERDAAGLFFASLGGALAGGGADAPGRIVVAVDGLDGVPPAAAAALVRTAGRLLGRPGFATVLAVDRAHLAQGFGDTDPALAAAEIARAVQVAYDLGGAPLAPEARSDLARRLLDGSAAPPEGSEPPRSSALDAPWRPGEAAVVAALAPVAGEGPRTVKRFVNTYRVARADPALRGAEPPVFTALALALAVAAHGLPDAWSALEAASRGEAALDEAGLLRDALAAARAAAGLPVELAQARRALDVARRYGPAA